MQGMTMLRLILVLSLVLSGLVFSGPAEAVTKVPPGNRNAEQPKIPAGSVRRTRSGKTTFDAKYEKIRSLLARDRELMGKIKKAARRFGIDPIHLVGALVGEHTYNVDAYDRLQNYYAKAMAYLGQSLAFKHDGVSISQLIAQPAFAGCTPSQGDYAYWTCVEQVWNRSYRGRSVAGKSWPNARLGRVFFQPLFAGQTFGLGQLNPLTALKVNDLVRAKVRGEPRLAVSNAPVIYNKIMEPDATLYYMAAVLRHSIDAYRSIAGFDISGNPGITATLYNLGNVTLRAGTLKAKNDERRAAGKPALLPEENYYGWLVNEKLPELRGIL